MCDSRLHGYGFDGHEYGHGYYDGPEYDGYPRPCLGCPPSRPRSSSPPPPYTPPSPPSSSLFINRASTIDGQVCILCMDAPPSMAHFPCGHMAFCAECLPVEVLTCSICRQSVNHSLQVRVAGFVKSTFEIEAPEVDVHEAIGRLCISDEE